MAFSSFAASVIVLLSTVAILGAWLASDVSAQAVAEAEPETSQEADQNQPSDRSNNSAEGGEQADLKVNAEALARVSTDIETLASKECGGRQPGKPGIKLAQDYLVKQYSEIGLKPLANGTYLQEFEVGRQTRLDAENSSLVLHGPDGTKLALELGKDWQAINSRGGHDLTNDLVFVGFGISAEELNYDEYANIDVKDKIVVIIRSEPQGKSEESVFHRDTPTRHASIRTKVVAARRAGAVGVILVNDSKTAPEDQKDQLEPGDRLGTMSLPFAQIKRSVFEKLIAKSPLLIGAGQAITSLKEVEELIDKNLEPVSQVLEGWHAHFKAKFVTEGIKTYNVIGVIPGEGPLANETVVIGAHYDHLGDGAYGSRAPGRREIHYGADDNASGTAAVVELARRFAKREKKPERRMVFICFSAEEMGLLGAVHYCENPEFPLEDTAMMVNFDMIGWLRNDELSVLNWNSSPQFASVLEQFVEPSGLKIIRPRMSFGGSDHLPFDSRRIPNMFFHTGLNEVYHTPEDVFSAINCEGAVRVIDYAEMVIAGLVALEKRPGYGPPLPFQLGVTLAQKDGGMTIEAIKDQSVAEKAGLQVGDIILEVAGREITSRRALSLVIRQNEGKNVTFKLKRDDAEVILHVDLVNPLADEPEKAEATENK
jgi:hypothetical protein